MPVGNCQLGIRLGQGNWAKKEAARSIFPGKNPKPKGMLNRAALFCRDTADKHGDCLPSRKNFMMIEQKFRLVVEGACQCEQREGGAEKIGQ